MAKNVHKNQVCSAERKNVQSLTLQLDSYVLWAFGPHQQGAAQFLPGTVMLK